MNKIFTTILASLLISISSYAADPWTKTQIGLEIGYQVALLCDWRQTSDFHKPYTDEKGKRWEYQKEANPLLGERPKQSTINNWCLLSSVGHVLISHYLPSEYRTVWQGVTFGIELDVVAYNLIGGKINIRF